MYHVLSTGFTALLLYLISYFFYRIGYYSLQLHRKFWNSVLALAFIVTAAAGVFTALQVNYKWNIPFIKTVLKWHVEFGIGMAMTGLFHLIWHLNYYLRFFRSEPSKPVIPESQKLTSAGIKSNLFIVGFVSSSVQFLLMREIMNVTGGYELITGSFLGSWLIASAIGASAARKSSLNDIGKINIVFSVGPLISVLLLLFLSRVFLSPGESPTFLISIVYTFLVLFPFCMISGFTFIKLITIAGSENNFVPGKSFSIETTGGIVAGIIITVFTSGSTGTYKLLFLILLLSAGWIIITYFIKNIKNTFPFKILLLGLSILVIILNPDLLFRQLLLPAIKVTESKDTPYGNITKGIYKGEESTYYNQRLLLYKDDATEREEDIHYALLQCDSPEVVIMISGSLQSHIPEILKYPIKNIYYIERDPDLVDNETDYSKKFSGKVVIVNKDAYSYISNSTEQADAIILLIPPPTTLLLNRYYTSEFFSAVKRKLKTDGVFMCSPGPGDSYFNKESLNLYSSVYNSLAASFRYVKPVVGNKLYFIASDKPVSLAFCQLAEKRKIKNIYVCSDFLDDDLIAKRSDEVNDLIDHGIKQNKSAFPVACLHSQSYQFSKNLGEKIPAIVLMFTIFALPVTTIKRKNLLMYFSASALAGFEIIILLTLQIMVGNMYQLTGLVIAGLMTGLAIGTGIKIRWIYTISLRNKVIFLMLFYIIFGLIYNSMIDVKSGILAVIIVITSGFLPAFITGDLFRKLTSQTDGLDASPAIYGADLAGSAFGFIFISGLAVPLLGIQVSVFILAALIFAGILFGTIRNKL
jgi:spermidine synthase